MRTVRASLFPDIPPFRLVLTAAGGPALRYVDHMLRRLNQVGIEMSVLRQLNNLPQSTTELYKTILDECQKARTEQEIATLKRFFAWLAYTTEPFFLSCASRLLRHIAPDTSISIEEEIENRCAG